MSIYDAIQEIKDTPFDRLDRGDLLLMIKACQEKLSHIRPITLTEVYKKCGKKDCSCHFGDVAEYGHGPYLQASYKDDDDKRKTKNLGKVQNYQWFNDQRSKIEPKWYNYRIGCNLLDLSPVLVYGV